MSRNYIRAYAFNGVEAFAYTDKDAMGDCRFCGQPDHFSINYIDGRYRCLKCECRGNLYTFLNRLHLILSDRDVTTPQRLKALSQDRGIPVEALRKAEIVWDDQEESWVIPIRRHQYDEVTRLSSFPIVNLKRWVTDTKTGKRVLYGTPTCRAHIFNHHLVTPFDDLYVCEGEWDAIALEQCLSSLSLNRQWRVEGLTGAGNSVRDLSTREKNPYQTYLLFDHDQAGRRGSIRAMKEMLKLGHRYGNIHVLSWGNYRPDTEDDGPGFRIPLPTGYDIRDLTNTLSDDEVYRYIREHT